MYRFLYLLLFCLAGNLSSQTPVFYWLFEYQLKSSDELYETSFLMPKDSDCMKTVNWMNKDKKKLILEELNVDSLRIYMKCTSFEDVKEPVFLSKNLLIAEEMMNYDLTIYCVKVVEPLSISMCWKEDFVFRLDEKGNWRLDRFILLKTNAVD